MFLRYCLPIFLGILISESALACSIPKPGFGWCTQELIDRATTIVVGVLESRVEEDSFVVYKLKPIEILRGKDPGTITFYSHSSTHRNDDFDAHTDIRFWAHNVGRSEFPCCICGPAHTFAEGERYLLFPDAFGARKSAEIVHTPADRWYRYVQERRNIVPNTALKAPMAQLYAVLISIRCIATRWGRLLLSLGRR